MLKHTLHFDALVDKHDAIDHILQNISVVGDVDECLTEKRVEFKTDVELTRNQRRDLLLSTGARKHEEEEM